MSRKSLTGNRELGIWTLVNWRWVGVDGTTPANADVWTLNLRLGGSVRGTELWLRVGAHWGAMFWWGRRFWQWHASGKKCDCYDCLVTGGPVRWLPNENETKTEKTGE